MMELHMFCRDRLMVVVNRSVIINSQLLISLPLIWSFSFLIFSLPQLFATPFDLYLGGNMNLRSTIRLMKLNYISYIVNFPGSAHIFWTVVVFLAQLSSHYLIVSHKKIFFLTYMVQKFIAS